jgi:hypothetical protein
MRYTTMRKERSDPFTDKVQRIFRILLSRERKRDLSWYRIAKDADVSYGWAYEILKDLEDDDIIKGSAVKDPRSLFEIWADRPDHRLFREYNVQNPDEVLKKAENDYVLTGYFAENLVGHYLFPRYRELYIDWHEIDSWHSYLSNNGFVGKGNLMIILADNHVFYEREEIDGWRVVSIQQLIVDLIRTGAECREAADILLDRVYK